MKNKLAPSETPRWGVSRARGTGCSNCLFYCTKSSTLWGAALLFCMDFMEQKEWRSETPRWGVSRNAPVGRF